MSDILKNIILPGTDVFGLSRYSDSNGETDHIAIYKSKVESVYISLNKKTGVNELSYLLMTPEGESWDCEVSSSDVALTREELFERMKPEWDIGWKDR